MKIGEQPIHKLKLITRCNHYLRRSYQHPQIVLHHIGINSLQRLSGCIPIISFIIRLPLFHSYNICRQTLAPQQLHPNIIQTLDGAQRCSAHHNKLVFIGKHLLNGISPHSYQLGMHLMPTYLCRFYRLKSTSPHMKRYLCAFNIFTAQRFQHIISKMQTRCGCSHRPLHLRINSLIRVLVTLLCSPIQIGRYGQIASHLQQFRKSVGIIVPTKHYLMLLPLRQKLFSTQHNIAPIALQGQHQRLILPFSCIAHHTAPHIGGSLLKTLRIIFWSMWRQTKHLYSGASWFFKQQPCMYYPSIVKHH